MSVSRNDNVKLTFAICRNFIGYSIEIAALDRFAVDHLVLGGPHTSEIDQHVAISIGIVKGKQKAVSKTNVVGSDG
jgi:hypothetical protein